MSIQKAEIVVPYLLVEGKDAQHVVMPYVIAITCLKTSRFGNAMV
jgi:hypothetical protein